MDAPFSAVDMIQYCDYHVADAASSLKPLSSA